MRHTPGSRHIEKSNTEKPNTEERTLNWLLATLRSSVGKKFVMGGTGLFLCFFLVVHLAGNFLLYMGPHAYNSYSDALHKNVAFLIAAEVGLFGAMLLHIYLAVTTAAENRAARGGQGYALRQTKVPGRVINFLGLSPDTTMFVSGALIFAYLCVHLCDFKFEIFADEAMRAADPYSKAARILGSMSRKVIYGIAALVVGLHVSHGFSSAFQSLGLSHPKYTPTIKLLGKIFAVVVSVGFGSFVFWDSERCRRNDDVGQPIPEKSTLQERPPTRSLSGLRPEDNVTPDNPTP